jgi:hypothetical protein
MSFDNRKGKYFRPSLWLLAAHVSILRFSIPEFSISFVVPVQPGGKTVEGLEDWKLEDWKLGN